MHLHLPYNKSIVPEDISAFFSKDRDFYRDTDRSKYKLLIKLIRIGTVIGTLIDGKRGGIML